MTEESNHCDVAVDSSPKTVIFSDERLRNNVDKTLQQRPRALIIDDQDTDSNADVESNADSENDDLISAYSVHSDVYGEDSKTKLLGSPLTALTFPPPPPVEEADFDQEENDISAVSLFQSISDAELSLTVETIVAAAIKEAVLVETIVTMAMKDAVTSIISLIHQYQEQGDEKIEKNNATNTNENAEKNATESENDDGKSQKVVEEKDDSDHQEESKPPSQRPLLSEESPVAKENNEKKQQNITNAIMSGSTEEKLSKTHKQNIQVPAHENTQDHASEPRNLDNSVSDKKSLETQRESNPALETQLLAKDHSKTDDSQKPAKDDALGKNEKADKLASNSEEVQVEINYKAPDTFADEEKLKNAVATNNAALSAAEEAKERNNSKVEEQSIEVQNDQKISDKPSSKREEKISPSHSTPEAEAKPLLVDSPAETGTKSLSKDTTPTPETGEKSISTSSTTKGKPKPLPADTTIVEAETKPLLVDEATKAETQTPPKEPQLNSSSTTTDKKEAVSPQNGAKDKNGSNQAAVAGQPKAETKGPTPANQDQTEKQTDQPVSSSAAKPGPEMVKKSGCCIIV